MKSQIIVLIPARFGSSRFPGKPLALFRNKELILHVYDKARAAFKNVFVATDDERIYSLVESHGGQAILTDSGHQSGTDRCAEALGKLPFTPDADAVVINLQGDEPFIPSGLLIELAAAFDNPRVSLATLAHPLQRKEDLENPNRVKVVMDQNQCALYFSRSAIPFSGNSNSFQEPLGFQHIGIYAFRSNTLKEVSQLPVGYLEQKESLEQLRWLEAGYKIHCLVTEYRGFGIDTPEDLLLADQLYSQGQE